MLQPTIVLPIKLNPAKFVFVMLSLLLSNAGMAKSQNTNTLLNISGAIEILQERANSHAKENIIVAVIDTGVDFNHEDLRDHIWVNLIEQAGLDGVDDDKNGCVDDIYGCDFRAKVKQKLGYYPGLGGAYYQAQPYMYADDMGHGTMVAGIIGAVANNGIGVDGVSQSVRIMSVKIIYPYDVASFEDAALAIRYAVDNGANIINNSYGKSRISNPDLELLEDAIEYANDHGVLVIAAAGNSAIDIDRHISFYPANIDADNIIVVTALDNSNQLWQHANFGYWSVDVAAPGVSILSTAPKGPKSLFRKFYDPSGYMSMDGTSMATSYVTGLAALLSYHFPDLSHLKIKQIILDSSYKLPSLADKIVAGGKIDMYNAVSLAASK